ncbi:sperm tail-domain-containing protein [Baffinella frigidus]|nr:sperm tail-domain-containing protein [Cryptophyta sp. CCMP2293]
MDSHEPSVDSKDREERIRARRLRITEKIQAKESGEAGTSVNVQKKKETDRKEVVKGKEQIAESRRKLRLLLEEGDEDVTKVRVEGDDRENQRRINEEAKRLDRRQKLLFEAESSARRNAAIAMKWASLFEKEIPLELLNDMEAQREACLKVISQKDQLVKEFQLVLRGKDEEYVKSLKRWAEDIDGLLGAMTDQFRQQQKQYEVETEEIEAMFRQERKELITANRTEMELLMEKRRNMEQVPCVPCLWCIFRVDGVFLFLQPGLWCIFGFMVYGFGCTVSGLCLTVSGFSICPSVLADRTETALLQHGTSPLCAPPRPCST